MWKDIKDCPGYQVSEYGDIKNIKTNKLLKQKVDRYGYKCIGFYLSGYKKYKTIHRVVAENYIPNPENKPQVNHKDGNKLNNHVSNLEWSTARENLIHQIETGLSNNNYPCSVFDNKHKVSYKFRSLKQLAKFFKSGPNTIVSYAKKSSLHPFMGRYIISIDFSRMARNSKNSKNVYYLYDYVTRNWHEYDSLSHLVYDTEIRSTAWKLPVTSNGYIVSLSKDDSLIEQNIDIDKILNQREINTRTGYSKKAQYIIYLYDYNNKTESEFYSIKEVADFLNSVEPTSVVISNQIVSGRRLELLKHNKTQLIKGFGFKTSEIDIDYHHYTEKELYLSSNGHMITHRVIEISNKLLIGKNELYDYIKDNFAYEDDASAVEYKDLLSFLNNKKIEYRELI